MVVFQVQRDENWFPDACGREFLDDFLHSCFGTQGRFQYAASAST